VHFTLSTSARRGSLGLLAAFAVAVSSATAAAPAQAAAPAPIKLTSSACPSTIVKGQKSGCVTELQNLLNKRGYDLVADGDFGTNTHIAVLSFQVAAALDNDGLVGTNTKNALYGTVTPLPGGGPAAMLAIAQGEVGTAEGATRTDRYSAAADLTLSTSGYSWCASFVSWVAQQTRSTAYRNSYVVGWVNQARNHTNGLSLTTSPRPGDIVAFDWDGGMDFEGGNEHIGIVKSVNGASFTTVEGNTGDPNGSGHDGVYQKSRGTTLGYDVLFLRVAG
jgi:peptidoglycan hydrolase-like protein with peptidoglycan-binding domain